MRKLAVTAYFPPVFWRSPLTLIDCIGGSPPSRPILGAFPSLPFGAMFIRSRSVSVTLTILCVGLSGIPVDPVFAAGRWNTPSTGLQSVGSGFGPGYHAPMVLGRNCKTSAVSPGVYRLRYPLHAEGWPSHNDHATVYGTGFAEPCDSTSNRDSGREVVGHQLNPSRTIAEPQVATPEVVPSVLLFDPPVLPHRP